MHQTVFYPDLGDFSRKYFVAIPGVPAPSIEETKASWEKEAANLFQNLLLFDKIAFRIKGESILIPILYRMLGARGLDTLIDQDAIEFILWDQATVYLVKNIPGLDGVATIEHSHPVYNDPEASIDSGLSWMEGAPTGRSRRKLVQKLVRLYRKPDADLITQSLAEVRSTLKNGGLIHYGLPATEGNIDNFNEQQKRSLVQCTEDFAEYTHLVKNDMTSFCDYRYFSPFWQSGRRFKIMNKTIAGFSQIANLHNMPDLKAVFQQVEDPLKRVPLIRKGRTARQFREWLSTTVDNHSDGHLITAYLDAVAGRKGFMDTAKGRVTKSLFMASLGTAAGFATSGIPGAVGGGIIATAYAERLIDFSAETALGLFDSILLERILKGWSPRMFMDDLSKLPKKEDN